MRHTHTQAAKGVTWRHPTKRQSARIERQARRKAGERWCVYWRFGQLAGAWYCRTPSEAVDKATALTDPLARAGE